MRILKVKTSASVPDKHQKQIDQLKSGSAKTSGKGYKTKGSYKVLDNPVDLGDEIQVNGIGMDGNGNRVIQLLLGPLEKKKSFQYNGTASPIDIEELVDGSWLKNSKKDVEAIKQYAIKFLGA